MGQIKNIKLHIVTDIKPKQHKRRVPHNYCSSKCEFLKIKMANVQQIVVEDTVDNDTQQPPLVDNDTQEPPPVDPTEALRQSIERIARSLEHASCCEIEQCQTESCVKMKGVIAHSKECERNQN